MDRVLQSNQFTSRQIRQVNYCRLVLQVHTVSDLATALGTLTDISLIKSQAGKSGKSTTAVFSSKYTPSLTWLQLSELILTPPSSVASPVLFPANQQNMKSGKNV
jgi:hypothetical protein